MPKKSGITEKHFTSLSDVAGSVSTLSVYGRLVRNSDVLPSTSGILHPSGADEPLQLAQVVGYEDQGRCIRLDEPQVVAMPAPDGPADGCGWDPTQYVVWKHLSKNWVTVHMQIRSSSLQSVLKSSAAKGGGDQQLSAGQAVQIITDCIPRAGGNNNPIELSNILQSYGLDKDGVVTFAGWVIGNSDVGVLHYGFRLAGDALSWLTVATKLIDVAKTIQDKAVPV
jgi:hypothetical protein